MGLTKLEFNICESVYLACNYETISPIIKNQLIKTIYDLNNKEAYIYLQWLFYRWSSIKPNNKGLLENISLKFDLKEYGSINY